jgi:phosphoglucosamine mutase
MARLFGTDGVRGVANVAPMTAEMVLEIGRATAYVCKQHPERRHTIVIGKDTRISGYMMESALVAGICSMGVDVMLLGPLPTPGVAYITRSMRADAGIMLSASHNPYQDNGIKIFSRHGFKLPDEEEDAIEDLITSGRIKDIRPTAEEVGKARRIDDVHGRYIVFCKNTFPDRLSLEGMKIVLDCANGATYRVAPLVFRELGAQVVCIHDQPDGLNINRNCGSQHTEDLRRTVLESKADLGLAFDGDGDRMIAVDEKGHEVSGDHILLICARMLKERGQLKNNLVVTTVMANFGLHVALRRLGIQAGVAAVGDRYVLEMMKEKSAAIGGESSGHMIFLDHHTTGDGIVSALQLLAAMKEAGQSLSQLGGLMSLTPQRMINVDVKHKPDLGTIPDIQKAITAAEAELQDQGRVLIRYSGTQSMCRVMVEGPTVEMTERLTKSLAGVVTQALNR